MSRISFVPRVSRVMAAAIFLLSAGFLGLAAQPPREEEDPKAKTAKKIVVDDDDAVGRKRPGDDGPIKGDVFTVPPDVRLEELVRAAAREKVPAIAEALTKYAVPFDRLVETSGVFRVKPIAVRKAKWPAGLQVIGVTPLDKAGKPTEVKLAKVAEIKEIDHFEKLVMDEADRLAKLKVEGATQADLLSAGEKLLRAALRFHDYSRIERKLDARTPVNLRRGDGWDEVRKPLVQKLRSVELELLQALVTSKDGQRLREHSARLLAAYSQDKEVTQAVAGVMVAEADRLLKTGTDTDAIAARKVLDELDASAPGTGGETAGKLRKQLRDMANKSITRAKEKKAVGDDRTAREELARAIDLDPENEGVRDLQRLLQVDYAILYVGVRNYPLKMSPATAKLDSERQAVELMFESLLEEVPDETGAVQYRTGAALTMPLTIPGGREFLLRALDRDPHNRPYFDSHDVVGTVEMLRTQPDSWVAYPVSLLSAEPPVPRDNTTVRLSFGSPHPDPRTAFTFKLLPYRWMVENNRALTDGRYAESPWGTGPFKLHNNQKDDGSGAPREMWFVYNPLYGKWPDRNGLPYVREIRFVEATKIDPVRAFQEGKLHILTDVPTAELDKYIGNTSTLRTRVDVVKEVNNRRVHMLAINLRRNYMQNKKLRQGISSAIDREDVLRKVFRAGKIDIHHAMTGPFPPGSWASSQGPIAPLPLFNSDLAVACFKQYFSDQGARKEIELLYPADDPQAKLACEEMQKQVAGLSTVEIGGDKVRLIINLRAVPLDKLLVQVQEEHTYDLAYVPFDYPDDWYPFALSAFLDPLAVGKDGRGGRNWFGFLTPGANPDNADQELGRALNKIRNYRDFTGQLAPQAVNISKFFNDSLPFVPLWQLDRNMVISKRVKVFVDDTTSPVSPRLLNQTKLFQGVGRWRLD